MKKNTGAAVANRNNFISDARQSIFISLHASLQSGRVSLKVSSTDEGSGGGGRGGCFVLILLNKNTVY